MLFREESRGGRGEDAGVAPSPPPSCPRTNFKTPSYPPGKSVGLVGWLYLQICVLCSTNTRRAPRDKVRFRKAVALALL